MQHRGAVVDEQRARGIVALDALRGLPEALSSFGAPNCCEVKAASK
jgi:hypothetical protein